MNQSPNRDILLVEPQPERANICVAILTSLGYDCIVVPDIEQACTAHLHNSQIMLVLLSSQISQPSIITNILPQIKGSYQTHVLLYFMGSDSLDDQFVTVDCNGYIFMDADPKQVLLQISNAMLQSQKQSETQIHLAYLSEGELIFKQLVEGMMEGLMVVDNDDAIKYINPKLNSLLGYEDQELIGKTGYQILLKPEDGAKIIERNQQRLLGISEDYELVMLTKSGEEIIFE